MTSSSSSSSVSFVELYRLTAALLLANYLINQVCSMGTFQVLIYRIPSSSSSSSSSSAIVCSSSDQQQQQQQRGLVYLRVCLSHFQARVALDRCTYGEGLSAPLLLRPPVASLPAEVDVAISFAWPGNYSLVIEAKCNSTGATATLEDGTPLRWIGSGQLIPSDQWTNQSSNPSSSSSSSSSSSGAPLRLDFGLRIVCDENLYGRDCSTFCKRRDDALGHFECSANGSRVCVDGWTNTDNYCVRAVCQSDCNHGNGTCLSPDRCSCFPGWTGTFCDVCIPAPGCSDGHGSCQLPGECNCETGWGGIYCMEDLEFCTNNRPCRNGGTCLNSGPTGYACDCAPGFAGPTCEDVCPPSHCYNGASCIRTPSGQFACSCPSGYTGEKCQSQIDYCQSYPCLNGGKCQNTSYGINCLCPAGFSGHLCDDVIANVTANSTDVIPVASPMRHYVVVVCLGVLIPLVVIATTAVVWFVVWRLNRRRRRRTKSSPSGGAESPASGGGAEGDNIRNDLKSLNNYAQRVGYQVSGTLKITNLAAEEGGGGGGGGVGTSGGAKVTAHAREVAAAPELSSSAAAAAAEKKLYGDLNFNVNAQTSSSASCSSSSPWTGKYEESEKNVLGGSNKRDAAEEEREEEEEDVIYSIDKSLDRFSSLSMSLDENSPSPSQFKHCCGKACMEPPGVVTPCPSLSYSSLSVYTDPCATHGDDRATPTPHCLPGQYSTLV